MPEQRLIESKVKYERCQCTSVKEVWQFGLAEDRFAVRVD
jgi:hypothetical protein